MTASATTGTAAVPHELVSLCRAGRNQEAIDRLYSEQIVSVEAVGNEQMPAVLSGIAAVRGQNEWWASDNEVHSGEVRADHSRRSTAIGSARVARRAGM